LNESVERKLSLRKRSNARGIPKSTLQRRVTGKVTHCKHASDGRVPAQPNEVENELCNYLKDLSNRGFPQRPTEVRSLVHQFAVEHGYSGIKEDDDSRYLILVQTIHEFSATPSLLKSEGLSVAQAMGCNKEV